MNAERSPVQEGGFGTFVQPAHWRSVGSGPLVKSWSVTAAGQGGCLEVPDDTQAPLATLGT